MPPKRDLFKPKPKTKAKAQEPQDENDYLEAADDHEQAAGKWRAGDAAKATRFFNRAIDMYNEGLKKFPKSFDLAYNKAVLEYNLTQDTRILPHLGPRIALLEETLKSHQTALAISPSNNTDIVFNTAQVLTSLAEAVLDAEGQQAARVPARSLLEDAVDLFAKCLGTQQEEYERVRLEIEAMMAQASTQEQANLDVSAPPTEAKSENESTPPDEWATVEEPLTPEAILETCTAQLNALTTLLSLYDPSEASAIEPRAQAGLSTAEASIPTLLTLIDNSPFRKQTEEESSGPTLSITDTTGEVETTPKDDALLAIATFRAALTELQYRAAQISSTDYATLISSLFTPLTQPPQTQSQTPAYLNAISAHADALIDLSSAIADTPSHIPTAPTYTPDTHLQWTCLTTAQKLLTTLSTAPYSASLPPHRLADAFLARGDVELFRFHLSFSSAAKEAWVGARGVLVGNAGVYYRGARTWAEKGGIVDLRGVADAKALVAEVVKEVHTAGGGNIVAKQEWKGRGISVKKVLEGMVEEGILGREEGEGVLRLLA